jgi:hypothetical protein
MAERPERMWEVLNVILSTSPPNASPEELARLREERLEQASKRAAAQVELQEARISEIFKIK